MGKRGLVLLILALVGLVGCSVPVQPTPAANSLASDDQVTVRHCLSTIGSGASLDQLRQDLLVEAKRRAVESLYGEMLQSLTLTENFVLTLDQIQIYTAGKVRLLGDPAYESGTNLADVCIVAKFYTTPDDRVEVVKILQEPQKASAGDTAMDSTATPFSEPTPISTNILSHTKTNTPSPTLTSTSTHTPSPTLTPQVNTVTATPTPNIVATEVEATVVAFQSRTATPTPTHTPTPIFSATRTFQLFLAVSMLEQMSIQPADVSTNVIDGAVYVFVPSGEFTMGIPKAGYLQRITDREPEHLVHLDSYWIKQTEVTNSEYSLCVSAGACTPPSNENWNLFQFSQHPVVNVNWSDAVAYADWVGGRLPTEAEWEKACRFTDKRLYPWGQKSSPIQANVNNDGGTRPVGSFDDDISPYGLLDMMGNVIEWTFDWYKRGYSSSPQANPVGPDQGEVRTLRGSSWLNDGLTCTHRNSSDPSLSYENVGFRVVIDALSMSSPISNSTVAGSPTNPPK